MATRVMVPVKTFSDRDGSGIGNYAAAIAGRMGAEIEIVLLAPTFLIPKSALGNLLINIPGMARELTGRCERRGVAIVETILPRQRRRPDDRRAEPRRADRQASLQASLPLP